MEAFRELLQTTEQFTKTALIRIFKDELLVTQDSNINVSHKPHYTV